MPSTTFKNLNRQKKELITNALLTEFSQHSLASAQVARIVKQAGIARGAFYKYFADLTEAYQYLYQVAISYRMGVADFEEALKKDAGIPLKASTREIGRAHV